MEATVSTLLREFPKVRRAALAGETVIIKTRDRNLRLSREESVSRPILGCLKGQLLGSDDDIDRPSSQETDWNPSV
jgi:hypothetical protein